MMNMDRAHLIGGTDAATLLGLGRQSPVALYLRLRGDIKDDFEGNTATRAGVLFEDRVAVELVRDELGLDLERPEPRALQLEDEPRIGASFDFTIPKLGALADIKLTGSRAMWGDFDRVPLHVAAQMQFQMAVARARGRAVPCVHVIAMFVPGFTIQDFEVEEDQQVGSLLISQARDMLKRVDQADPPPAGTEADARALFLGRRETVHICTEGEMALIEQLRITKTAYELCEKQEQEIRDALLPAFGNATEIVSPDGEVVATWRPNKVFNAQWFMTDNPDLVQQFRKEGIDVTRLGKERPKLKESYMQDPVTPSEAVRPFKLAKRKETK